MPTSDTWDRVVVDVREQRPDPALLRDLVDGRAAVVVLRGLLREDAFTRNLARVRELFGSASTTQYVNGTLTTIGPYLNKYLDDLDGYFQAAKESETMLAEASFDLAARTRQELREQFGLKSLEPAREPDGREYAGSVVRIHADGVRNPLHNDNIMRDARNVDIVLRDLAYQLSCVVCLQECTSGGELWMYRKPWEPTDEQHKIPGHLGYDEQVVAGVPAHEFKPRTGDVYLINPTRYHAIERVSGTARLTMGFFIGFADDALDSAAVWG